MRVFTRNEKGKVSFKSVAGQAEAKQDLQEVVEFHKYPKKFASLGPRIPKGVLLVDPPDTAFTVDEGLSYLLGGFLRAVRGFLAAHACPGALDAFGVLAFPGHRQGR